jgi:hypothetical protein
LIGIFCDGGSNKNLPLKCDVFLNVYDQRLFQGDHNDPGAISDRPSFAVPGVVSPSSPASPAVVSPFPSVPGRSNMVAHKKDLSKQKMDRTVGHLGTMRDIYDIVDEPLLSR